MGRRKGLLPWRGESLLRAHVRRGREMGLEVHVVLGPDLAAHLAELPPDVRWTWNGRYAVTEMLDSLLLGLEGCTDALVTPVDVPPAAPDTLRGLLAAGGDAVPTWQGRDGHPVRVVTPSGEHPRVRLDVRLRGATRVPVDDPAVCANLNTPEDLMAWSDWVAAETEPLVGRGLR